MGIKHALGWALPIDDFLSSPFFDGLSSRDNKLEYLYQVLNSFNADNINGVLDVDDIPIWLRSQFNDNEVNQALILKEDGRGTLHDLIEFVGPSPDDTTHVFIWPSWYGKSKTFRTRCDIDHALYGDSDFIIKENSPPSTMLYGKSYMDENGVPHDANILSEQHLSIMEWNMPCLTIRHGVPKMFRAWNSHVGLLDLPRIAKMKYMAARYWG